MQKYELLQKQSLSLDQKITLSKQRIRDWIEWWDYNVYVSFSGGKDSTVLAHLVRQIYPDVPIVFVNTGMEFPEIVKFCRQQNNLIMLHPTTNFRKVIEIYGYPIISKRVSRYVRDLKNPTDGNQNTRNLRLTGYNTSGEYRPNYKLSDKWQFLVDAPFKVSEKCCDVMKKNPFKRFEKETGLHPFTGEMADDNDFRCREYLKSGCNAFDNKNPKSMPIGFWTEQDILHYIKEYNVPYCSVYGDIIEQNGVYSTTGESRTGCVFCMFGIHYDKDRFVRLKKTHPAMWKYCINKIGIGNVLDFIGIDKGE